MEELWKLDAVTLKSLYDQHQKELNLALLDGADWSAVEEERKLVTELSILLYHRTISASPADFNTRNTSSSSSLDK